MKNALVVYFSATGVTKRIANMLCTSINADVFEIVPREIYTQSDLDWTNDNSRSSLEMHDKSSRPEIERNLISQRTKASLANVKSKGKRLGRPFSAQSKKLKLSKNTKKVKELLDMGLTRYRIAKIMQVKQTTVSRFIQRMGWEY